MTPTQTLSVSLTCAEHAPDVGVPLVEALLHDGVDKGGSVEERPLVRLTVILLRNFSASGRIKVGLVKHKFKFAPQFIPCDHYEG